MAGFFTRINVYPAVPGGLTEEQEFGLVLRYGWHCFVLGNYSRFSKPGTELFVPVPQTECCPRTVVAQRLYSFPC